MSDLTCCLFPEAGAGPALPIAAHDHDHDPDQNLTPQEGGAGPGLAAPLLRKLLFISLFTWTVQISTVKGTFLIN